MIHERNSQIWLQVRDESKTFLRILQYFSDLLATSCLNRLISKGKKTSLKFGDFGIFFHKNPLYGLQWIIFWGNQLEEIWLRKNANINPQLPNILN
jgi:hypothetical protein